MNAGILVTVNFVPSHLVNMETTTYVKRLTCRGRLKKAGESLILWAQWVCSPNFESFHAVGVDTF